MTGNQQHSITLGRILLAGTRVQEAAGTQVTSFQVANRSVTASSPLLAQAAQNVGAVVARDELVSAGSEVRRDGAEHRQEPLRAAR
ncbi:hypothetical protein [Rhodococcus sp. MS16]|uniref:hypothetical protein n=1 Tax=Rhodococcus sp. MS16 TaxID=2579941 RepID=UPI001F5B20D2|nr:hypothetical protein [Rhodococcus sp. MS16]